MPPDAASRRGENQLTEQRSSRRPSHQAVVAYLALFLVLVGGTAYAAATIDSGDVINGSLKSIDLKNNGGVTGADVPANNLRAADFGRGSRASIGGADVANNALGANQVNEGSLAASRVVARLGGPVGQPIANVPSSIPFAGPTSYTQAANQLDEFLGGGQMTFLPTCTAPRSATIYLLLDNPVLVADALMGFASVSDSTGGTVAKEYVFTPFFGGGPGMVQPVRAAATPHQLYLAGDLNCNSGSGATLDSAIIDVVGHR